MTAELRSELLKQRSTRTGLGLFAGLLGLVLVAMLLHAYALPARILDSTSTQLMVFGRGGFLAILFAALLGALSITSEIRYGTIRSTFLVSPRRGRVIVAKVWASMLVGAAFGLAASALAAGVGTAALRARGIDVQLSGGDYALLIAGGAAAAGLWAAIGVGLGAVLRNQVPTLIGICAWLLFVEGLLVGDIAALGDVGRYLPGAAAAAISVQNADTLLSPVVGLVLLVIYATVAVLAGLLATARRDVA